MDLDVAMCDELLGTTRAVRKRLDFERPVPRAAIMECIGISMQAPTGSNSQGWRWMVVDDAGKRRALADLYRLAAKPYLTAASGQSAQTGDTQTQRVFSSAMYLMERLQDAPVHVIPCLASRLPDETPATAMAGYFGSIFPAVWSFQLALRARGLGSCLTTLHLAHEREAAELLGIPEGVMQVALLPVAYTLGTHFKRAARPAPDAITHWNAWAPSG